MLMAVACMLHLQYSIMLLENLFLKAFLNNWNILMNLIQSQTCIRFRARTSADTDWIRVYSGSGCSSYV